MNAGDETPNGILDEGHMAPAVEHSMVEYTFSERTN